MLRNRSSYEFLAQGAILMAHNGGLQEVNDTVVLMDPSDDTGKRRYVLIIRRSPAPPFGLPMYISRTCRVPDMGRTMSWRICRIISNLSSIIRPVYVVMFHHVSMKFLGLICALHTVFFPAKVDPLLLPVRAEMRLCIPIRSSSVT